MRSITGNGEIEAARPRQTAYNVLAATIGDDGRQPYRRVRRLHLGGHQCPKCRRLLKTRSTIRKGHSAMDGGPIRDDMHLAIEPERILGGRDQLRIALFLEPRRKGADLVAAGWRRSHLEMTVNIGLYRDAVWRGGAAPAQID